MKTLALATMAATALSAVGGTLYTENFRNYADQAPNVVADNGMVVANDPIWRRAAELNVNPVREGCVFVRPIALPKDGAWDFLFNVKFANASTNNPGRIVLRFEGGKDLVLTPTDFGGHKLPHAIPNGAWTECAVKAKGGQAELYVAPDREYVKVGAVPVSGTSLNFAVASNKCFAVTDLALRTPSALPEHPVEALFADFRSLAKPFADAKTAAGTEQVALKTDASEKLRFALGSTNATAKISFAWSDGRKESWLVKVIDQGFNLLQANFGLKRGAKYPLADSAIAIGGEKQFVRPLMRNWCSSYDIEKQGVDVLREWNRLPPASQHVVDLELVKGGDGKTRLYVDGSYVKTVVGRKGETPDAFVFEPGKGVRYALVKTAGGKKSPSKFVPLDLAENPRAKAFANAKVSAQPPKDVPFAVADGRDSADVAICHEGKGNWALEVEEYLGRSPTWGFPSAVHYRVPAAAYGRVHLLFALDDDPAKDRILTVRFGHYLTNGTGGNTLGDVRLDFTKGLPADCRKVGTVVRGGKTFDLYYLAVETNLGPIVDLAARRDFLDFEFMGRPFESFQQIDNSMKPHPDYSSAFNLFGVTLERASALMDMVQRAPGNVFTADERDRATAVLVRATEDGAKGSLAWTAKDTEGAVVFEGRRDFAFAKAGETNVVEISLADAKKLGYYTLDLTLDAGGAKTRHEAAFAVLPEAGRAWRREACPWGTWWFQHSHGAPGDFPTCGPQLKKAGIRKTTAKIKKGKEAESYSYDVTTCGNVMAPPMRDCKDEATFVKKIQAQLDMTPNADHILIWHESAPHCSQFPEELLGQQPDPAQHEADKKIAEYVNRVGELVRKHFPQLKIQLGNSSASLGAATRPLRGGANPDYYDYMGIETPSQAIVPERVIECGFLGFLATKEAASLLAKREVKVNGTWEFIYRCERDMGEEQQAEWYARDAIISISHDFFLINIGLLHDCCLGYYNGLWGASGIIRRAPYVYPKRAYVAYANVTKMLDDVKFSRALDTGSTTVYANEFKRADGKVVTVLWSARGKVDFKVVAPSGFLGMGGGGTVTEMYGETRSLAGGESVVAGGTAPIYLVTDKPLEAVAVAGRSWPKEERILAAGKAYPTGDATLAADPEMETKKPRFLPILKPGDFKLEKTAEGLAVTIDTAKPQASHYVTEYTTVRFAKPVELAGEPSVLGIKVNGNSNWGQLRFEIEDADGEVFKNLSTGSAWGCDIMDWPGNLAVDFDGWGMVFTAVRDNTLMNDRSPGPVSDQWVSTGGDKKIRYPIKVRAVTVGMNRWASTLFGFEPLKNPTVVLGDIVGAE